MSRHDNTSHDPSSVTEFLKFVGPIGPWGQKIMRSANNVGPHVRQTFLNDVFTFLTEVGNAGRVVNTGTGSYKKAPETTQVLEITPVLEYCLNRFFFEIIYG